jgi:hypothetical protein
MIAIAGPPSSASSPRSGRYSIRGQLPHWHAAYANAAPMIAHIAITYAR